MTPDHFLLYDSDQNPAQMVRLHAGPVAAVFDPERAFLRNIQFEDGEVLRGTHKTGNLSLGVFQ